MLIHGVSDISITRSGVRSDFVCDLMWGAHFKFDIDISGLFAYINGTKKEAQYYDHPCHIRFDHDNVRCTLYPREAIAAPFRGREHALGFIENLVHFLNELYDRREKVPPNHKTQKLPVSIVDIVKVLPRTNCRQCGYPTCLAFAAALRSGEALPSVCPEFPEPIATHAIYPIFGENQKLESTFTIGMDGSVATNPNPHHSVRKPESGQAPTGGTDGDEPIYDRFGIRIQKELTRREVQVLQLMAEGATNPEISERLNISPHTVKSHVIHIFNKLNVNDRTQAAVWAARNQVI